MMGGASPYVTVRGSRPSLSVSGALVPPLLRFSVRWILMWYFGHLAQYTERI